MSDLHKVYVYGTLRPNRGDTVFIPGKMYDLGWFPGVLLEPEDSPNKVVAEVLRVDDGRLAELDRYEGYRPHDHEHSLYIRRSFRDGWIYEYNQRVDNRVLIESGDWIWYRDTFKGKRKAV